MVFEHPQDELELHKVLVASVLLLWVVGCSPTSQITPLVLPTSNIPHPELLNFTQFKKISLNY